MVIYGYGAGDGAQFLKASEPERSYGHLAAAPVGEGKIFVNIKLYIPRNTNANTYSVLASRTRRVRAL